MQKDASDAGKTPSHRTGGGPLQPDEYKDSPIRFSMVLEGRREEVKIVEPKVDVALPHDGRLLVHDGDRCLYDLTFRFDNTAQRPYQLRYGVKEGVSYAEDHVLGFGEPPPADKQFRKDYREDLLEQGGVQAWIAMTGGKARLLVRYKGR